MRHLFTQTLFSSIIFLLSMNLGFAANSMMVFTADWCGGCKAFKKALDENPGALDDYQLELINFDQNREIAKQLKVRSIPTFIIYDENDREVARKVGFESLDELKTWLEHHAD